MVIFHEEVMRHLGIPGDLPRIEAFVRERALERGFPPVVVSQVWQVLAGFGSFGFAKAHGAAFAFPTCQSAWLEAHHPAQFLAGLLTHDPGIWPKDLIVVEARLLGVPVLALDVQDPPGGTEVLAGQYQLLASECAQAPHGVPYPASM